MTSLLCQAQLRVPRALRKTALIWRFEQCRPAICSAIGRSEDSDGLAHPAPSIPRETPPSGANSGAGMFALRYRRPRSGGCHVYLAVPGATPSSILPHKGVKGGGDRLRPIGSDRVESSHAMDGAGRRPPAFHSASFRRLPKISAAPSQIVPKMINFLQIRSKNFTGNPVFIRSFTTEFSGIARLKISP